MKWLKMDCDAQENLDMRKLVDEWGWEWYGRYWAILGKVGMLITEKHQSFALQTNDGSPFSVRLLANDLSTNVERLTEFCTYLANNHLIDKKAWNEKSLIYVPKLRDRADEYTKKLLTKSRQTPVQEVEEEVEEDKKKTTVAASDFSDMEQYLLQEWGKEGRVGWSIITDFIDLGKKHSKDKLYEAIKTAAQANIKNFRYVKGILNNPNNGKRVAATSFTPCPNGCGQSLTEHGREAHLMYQCPRRKI